MVDAAKTCRSRNCETPTRIVADEMSGAKKSDSGNADVSIYEIMERCSLNESRRIELKNYVESKG
jgi:N-acetylneuraminate synthase